MSSKTIMHVCLLDKFIPAFIDFIGNNFEEEQHIFVLRGDINRFPVKQGVNIFHLNSVSKVSFIKTLYKADKIILHSLFGRGIVLLLSIQPWLLRKCYWVMWGGDLYYYQFAERNLKSYLYEMLRCFVIKRISHFITYVKGDYELVKKWYGGNGKYHECFAYPSNLYQPYTLPKRQDGDINILVGNSADPSNNHKEIFEKLLPYKDKDIKIYCPLSYGNPSHAEEMVKLGKELFGEKYVALIDLMTFDKYLELLGQIDIAVFAHRRQQAMGNTISLLGLGKKVFMRSDVSSWQVFQDIDVKVFDIENFDLVAFDPDVCFQNRQKIEGHFSCITLTQQWKAIFESK